MSPPSRDLIISKTDNGEGIVAGRAWRAGEEIREFHGLIFTPEQMPKPYDEVEDHYVQIGRRTYMGPSGEENDYFNHSCDPNAGLVIEPGRVWLKAIKDIAPGTEITWDYSTTMDEDDWEMTCGCGSPMCRGVIRDFKRLPREIQERYAGLGVVPGYNLEYLKDRP